MLPVNEDTNDELFRKAAGDYQLKAENPDWNALAPKLQDHDTTAAVNRARLGRPAIYLRVKFFIRTQLLPGPYKLLKRLGLLVGVGKPMARTKKNN
jgi:hypothetical protein